MDWKEKDQAMQLPIYQIDAFASRVFAGNPAAVCPLEEWLPDATMQAIAAENNLSETAFFCREGDDYAIRWFTPGVEVELCGHATLASGYLLLTRLTPEVDIVQFSSRSGPLSVIRKGDEFALDFPAQPASPAETPAGLADALSAAPSSVLTMGQRLFAVFDDAAQVRGLTPDMVAVARLAPGGLTATAPDTAYDFVSRHFAPSHGIPEDPVTGSTHTTLTPYWAERLGKATLRAAQLSARGGELNCTLDGDRVEIAGQAVLYMEGKIQL
jgi:PhzF family phenazine biosynthesis protein